MRREILPALFLAAACLAAPAPAAAQTVELPAEVKAPPGLVIVEAKTDCPSVQWYSIDPGLGLIPAELLKDSRKAVGFAATAGRYRLLAYGAKADVASKPAVCVVVVGDAPPGPDPGPGPQPPPVTDPFVKALQDAYAADRVPANLAEKAAALKTLADLHGGMGRYCNDPTVTTAGQLAAGVHAAILEELGDKPDGKLIGVRTAIALEELKSLPLPKAKALTAADRVAAAAFYARVSAALKQVRGVR